jgi:hypothetical protein
MSALLGDQNAWNLLRLAHFRESGQSSTKPCAFFVRLAKGPTSDLIALLANHYRLAGVAVVDGAFADVGALRYGKCNCTSIVERGLC